MIFVNPYDALIATRTTQTKHCSMIVFINLQGNPLHALGGLLLCAVFNLLFDFLVSALSLQNAAASAASALSQEASRTVCVQCVAMLLQQVPMH